MKRAARIDKNQPAIVDALRKEGAHVTITSQLKKFADIVAVHRGTVYIAEIKDGTRAKSSKKLTPGEVDCKKSIEAAGGTYYVLESVRDALLMIGIDNTYDVGATTIMVDPKHQRLYLRASLPHPGELVRLKVNGIWRIGRLMSLTEEHEIHTNYTWHTVVYEIIMSDRFGEKIDIGDRPNKDTTKMSVTHWNKL